MSSANAFEGIFFTGISRPTLPVLTSLPRYSEAICIMALISLLSFFAERHRRARRNSACRGEYVSDGKGSARRRDAEDVPFHQPDLYVVLSGFHDPDLPVELLSAGVPLTCILQIQLPGEPVTACRADEPTFARGASLSADYRADEGELLDFWTITNRRFSDPSTHPAYSNIALLTFRPPLLPRSYRGLEKRSLMRDTYDEMSRTLRHLHHLHRQHADYLGSMKLEKRILETRSASIDTRIYEDTLRDISNECIDVPLILCAMLLQVEADLAGSPDEYTTVECNAELRGANMSGEDISTSRVPQNEVRSDKTLTRFRLLY